MQTLVSNRIKAGDVQALHPVLRWLLKLVNKKAKCFDRAVQCFNMATVWATGSGVNLCSVVSA